MVWAVPADPDFFEEAVDWFTERLQIPDELIDALKEAFGRFASEQAFWVAGISDMRVIDDVFGMIERAIRDGTGFREFKKEAAEKLVRAWGSDLPREGVGFRIETIFRNNAQTAYNRGRWNQITHPDVLGVRPFLMYDAVLDERTTKEICRPLNGTILPASDPFWDSHTPPLHHRCRSALRSLTRRQAERRGISRRPPEVEPTDGFGANPDSAKDFRPRAADFPADLFEAFQKKQAERKRR